jgi:hypothetical protein
MILDTLLCDYLLKKKLTNNIIIYTMVTFYIAIYTSLYFLIFEKAFDTKQKIFPVIIVLFLFFVYRIITINKYLRKHGNNK